MIGIFDSGLGGLSVLKEIRAKAPNVDVLYFGDTLNAPYGPRSTEELVVLTLQAMHFLQSKGVTQFVAACNSVSVSVIQPLFDLFGNSNGRVIEMVEPTARSIGARKDDVILVLVTEATVRSGLYEKMFRQQGVNIHMLAIPDLAGAIERGASEQEVYSIIMPAISRMETLGAYSVIFGCTHYPLVRSHFETLISMHVKNDIRLIDPAYSVAQEVSAQFDLSGSGRTKFFLSKDSSVFRDQVSTQLGIEYPDIDIISLS